MSSYTELIHRELDILKQELRRTCAVDRPHKSIKRFAISQQVGHDIVPYAAQVILQARIYVTETSHIHLVRHRPKICMQVVRILCKRIRKYTSSYFS